jgi:hypothetical protein
MSETTRCLLLGIGACSLSLVVYSHASAQCRFVGNDAGPGIICTATDNSCAMNGGKCLSITYKPGTTAYCACFIPGACTQLPNGPCYGGLCDTTIADAGAADADAGRQSTGNACNSQCQCVPCGAPLTDCGGQCVDTRSDSNNCGHCGNACPPLINCISGTCACPGTQIACAGACVDTTSDPNNCGACGVVCASCANGACSASSTADPHMRTFDGLAYDLQAAGEFILAADGNGFVLQARQEP